MGTEVEVVDAEAAQRIADIAAQVTAEVATRVAAQVAAEVVGTAVTHTVGQVNAALAEITATITRLSAALDEVRALAQPIEVSKVFRDADGDLTGVVKVHTAAQADLLAELLARA